MISKNTDLHTEYTCLSKDRSKMTPMFFACGTVSPAAEHTISGERPDDQKICLGVIDKDKMNFMPISNSH